MSSIRKMIEFSNNEKCKNLIKIHKEKQKMLKKRITLCFECDEKLLK